MSLTLPLVYTLDYAASASFFWGTYNNSTQLSLSLWPFNFRNNRYHLTLCGFSEPVEIILSTTDSSKNQGC